MWVAAVKAGERAANQGASPEAVADSMQAARDMVLADIAKDPELGLMGDRHVGHDPAYADELASIAADIVAERRRR